MAGLLVWVVVGLIGLCINGGWSMETGQQAPWRIHTLFSVECQNYFDWQTVISGRRHVGIMSAEPVGNYAVRIIFDDLHKTGIYSWDYFYHLGSNKYSLMKNYIKTLRKYGLSRDPPKRK